MEQIFAGKKILVTGGCGSIGSEIIRQLLVFKPAEIRVLDSNENGHFLLNQQISSKLIRNIIGDIRDKERVLSVMEDVDIVFHAAALKHVPFCELNPSEAVLTNVIGTKNVVDAALVCDVKIFVGISTDKAVSPINTMGATKLLAEKLITNAPVNGNKTRFCCVRFGNVLASAGSIIPIFQHQIAEGNTVTITSSEMTRFFMSIEDAVTLVLRAATISKNGETFILKMKALKITDLADAVIEILAPRHNKDPKSFKKEFIGIRPGEKLHEELMSREEALYMEERDDMLVLHNSTLAQREGHTPKQTSRAMSEYNTMTVPPMSKEDIKRHLIEKKIL